MPESDQGSPPYRVIVTTRAWRELQGIQRKAARQGRGEEVLSSLRRVAERLQTDPNELGEPLYRLPELRMLVRSAAIKPLVVDYGVCEDRRVVFVQFVKMLSKHKG